MEERHRRKDTYECTEYKAECDYLWPVGVINLPVFTLARLPGFRADGSQTSEESSVGLKDQKMTCLKFWF